MSGSPNYEFVIYPPPSALPAMYAWLVIARRLGLPKDVGRMIAEYIGRSGAYCFSGGIDYKPIRSVCGTLTIGLFQHIYYVTGTQIDYYWRDIRIGHGYFRWLGCRTCHGPRAGGACLYCGKR